MKFYNIMKKITSWMIVGTCAITCMPATSFASDLLTEFNVTLNVESVQYDGEEHPFFVEVKDNTGKVLEEGKDFTISLVNGQAETSKTALSGTQTIIVEPEHFEDTITYIYPDTGFDQYGVHHNVYIEHTGEYDETTNDEKLFMRLDNDPFKYQYMGKGKWVDAYNEVPPEKGVYYRYGHEKCGICEKDILLEAHSEKEFFAHLENCKAANWIRWYCYGFYKHVPAKTETIPTVYRTNFWATTAGGYELQINGIGNYSGSILKKFSIVQNDITSTAISDIADKYYTGNSITQNITVTYKNRVLSLNKDYTIEYSNNIYVGTATMVITGKGNFTGSVTKQFSIIEKVVTPTPTPTPKPTPTPVIDSQDDKPKMSEAEIRKKKEKQFRATVDKEIFKRVPATAASIEGGKYPKWSNFRTLALRHKANTDTSITLKWNKVSGAYTYALCGGEVGKKIKSIGLVNGLSSTRKGLKRGKYYRFAVFAFNSNGKVIASSKFVYICTSGGKYSNYKSLTFKNNLGNLSVGTRGVLIYNATAHKSLSNVKVNRKIAVESTDPKVAVAWTARTRIGSKMQNVVVVKPLAKGTCYIYVYLQNGVYAKKLIRVS